MIAKNRICCKYTEDKYNFVKKEKFNYCPKCGKYLNEFELDERPVVYDNKLYNIDCQIMQHGKKLYRISPEGCGLKTSVLFVKPSKITRVMS